MVGGGIFRDTVFLREGGVRTLAQSVARAHFAILPDLEAGWEFLFEALYFLSRANTVSAIADREQLRISASQAARASQISCSETLS